MFGRISPFRTRVSSVLVQVGDERGFKTQEDLANCIGISDRTLRRWIKRGDVDLDRLEQCEPIWIPFLERLLEVERAVHDGRA